VQVRELGKSRTVTWLVNLWSGTMCRIRSMPMRLNLAGMLECFITAELPRSSAPRAALQLQGPFSSGGFRETWSHCTHAHAWKCQAHARVAKSVFRFISGTETPGAWALLFRLISGLISAN
jgi:hypothetical protein